MRNVVKIPVALLLLLALGWTGLRVMAARAQPPLPPGIHDGKLSPCPASPNCVSSYETSPEHRIAPLPVEGDPETALARLDAVVSAMPGAALADAEDNYRHYIFRTALVGYIDDVEFYRDGDRIHLRSASRSGYSDLGVNRKRIAQIRKAYLAAP